MIRSVLVANRGEIALRIVRAVRARGLRAVAVYSEVDRLAPHVLAADEAYAIGGAPASESYLCGSRLIEVAKRAGQTVRTLARRGPELLVRSPWLTPIQGTIRMSAIRQDVLDGAMDRVTSCIQHTDEPRGEVIP